MKRPLAIELALVCAAAAVYLTVFSGRPRYVDLLVGASAVAAIAFSAERSRRLWEGDLGAAADAPKPAGAWRGPLIFTAAGVVALAAASLMGERAGLVSLPPDRFGNWHLLLAIGLYFPWAWLQQFVFQFYLLGRLLRLLPAALAVSATALAFAAVHYPRYPIMALTAIAGAAWAMEYRRHRRLAPLATSHAVLGPVMHYWLLGRDLLAGWLP